MRPEQPPNVIYVQQQPNRAATVGIWVIVAWIVGPFLVLALCCVGCFFAGGLGMVAVPFLDPTPTPTPW